jgi:hypothetical protein
LFDFTDDFIHHRLSQSNLSVTAANQPGLFHSLPGFGFQIVQAVEADKAPAAPDQRPHITPYRTGLVRRFQVPTAIGQMTGLAFLRWTSMYFGILAGDGRRQRLAGLVLFIFITQRFIHYI